MSWILARRVLSFGVIGIALVIFVLGYLLPSIRTYTDFNLNTFDYAILYEGVMRFVSGEPTFMNSRGVYALADNQEYWQFFWAWIFLFPIPHLALLVSHSLILLTGAFAMCASFFRKNDLVFSLLAVAFFVHPVPYRMTMDIVHSETFNFLLVPLLVLSIEKNKPRLSLLLSLLICLTKEDSCLYLAGFWMVYAVFHWREWKMNPAVMALRILIPVVVFGINYFAVLPHYLKLTCEALNLPFDPKNVRPANHWFDELYTTDQKFQYIFELLTSEKTLRYLGLSFWPVFLYRRKYLWLALAASGQILLNCLTRYEYLTAQAFHYDHFAFPVIWMGMFLSFYQSRNYFWTTVRAFAVLAISIGLSVTVNFFSYPRIWTQFQSGIAIGSNDSVQEIKRLSSEIQEANISADWISAPYLMKPKRSVSTFPNTLEVRDYGVENCMTNSQLPDLVVLQLHAQTPENGEILQRHGYSEDLRFSNYLNFKVWRRF